jgi:lysophospholipase L1-like esterase
VRGRSILLPPVMLLALLLTPKDIPYDDAGVAFLGDSITLGAYASGRSSTFASRVTQDLDKRGVQEESRIFISLDPEQGPSAASQVMKKDRDFVVIELGVHATMTEQITPDQFRQIYSDILNCVAGDETIVVVGTVPWLGWAPDDVFYSRAEQFSQIITEEAAKRQVAVADLWSATKLRSDLLSTPQGYAYLPPNHGDGFHPGDAGHAVIADVYAKALAGELANPPKRPYQRTCH